MTLLIPIFPPSLCIKIKAVPQRLAQIVDNVQVRTEAGASTPSWWATSHSRFQDLYYGIFSTDLLHNELRQLACLSSESNGLRRPHVIMQVLSVNKGAHERKTFGNKVFWLYYFVCVFFISCELPRLIQTGNRRASIVGLFLYFSSFRW